MPLDPYFTSAVKVKEQTPPNHWWRRLDGNTRGNGPSARNRKGYGKSNHGRETHASLLT